jgi:hypothetical protein
MGLNNRETREEAREEFIATGHTEYKHFSIAKGFREGEVMMFGVHLGTYENIDKALDTLDAYEPPLKMSMSDWGLINSHG